MTILITDMLLAKLGARLFLLLALLGLFYLLHSWHCQFDRSQHHICHFCLWNIFHQANVSLQSIATVDQEFRRLFPRFPFLHATRKQFHLQRAQKRGLLNTVSTVYLVFAMQKSIVGSATRDSKEYSVIRKRISC